MNVKDINIVLLDANMFFAQGVRCVISEHLLRSRYTARFLDLNHRENADLLMLTESFVYIRYHCLHPLPPFIITIKDAPRKYSYSGRLYNNSRYVGAISRNSPRVELTQLLDKTLEALEASPPRPAHDAWRNIALTPRENEILQKIADGLSPNIIANKLSISNKTVSEHKRSAMRKLGFRRSHELYIWLRYREKNL